MFASDSLALVAVPATLPLGRGQSWMTTVESSSLNRRYAVPFGLTENPFAARPLAADVSERTSSASTPSSHRFRALASVNALMISDVLAATTFDTETS